MLALTWEDINFSNKTIDINKTEFEEKTTKPKTKASNRIIMLPTCCIQLLEELKREYSKEFPVKNNYVVFGNFITALLFPLRRNYQKYLKLAGVKPILLHEFRHSHASYLINKGVSPLVVAQRLGHSNVSTTLNTYSHLYPSKQAEVVAFMESDLI